MDYVLTFLVIVANVLGAGMILPQVLRLSRGGTADGVSTVGVGVGMAQNLWWVAYGLQADGAMGIVPVSVAGVLLYSTIGVQLVGLVGRRCMAPIIAGFAGIGIVPMVPYLLVDLQAAGLTIGLLYGVQFAPAAFAVARTREPVGVSAATWSMAWVEAAIWLIYGLTIGDSALALGGGGGSVMAGLILVRLAATRPQIRPRLAV